MAWDKSPNCKTVKWESFSLARWPKTWIVGRYYWAVMEALLMLNKHIDMAEQFVADWFTVVCFRVLGILGLSRLTTHVLFSLDGRHTEKQRVSICNGHFLIWRKGPLANLHHWHHWTRIVIGPRVLMIFLLYSTAVQYTMNMIECFLDAGQLTSLPACTQDERGEGSQVNSLMYIIIIIC